MKTQWVIICDSRKRNEILFMVDRNKQRKSFWSNQTSDVKIFNSLDLVNDAVKKLSFNNPRIVTLVRAREIEKEQCEEQVYD